MTREEHLSKALRRLWLAAPIGLDCRSFHHSSGERHRHDEECRPVEEYLAALKEAQYALEESNGN